MARTAYRRVDESVVTPFLKLIKINMVDVFQETDKHHAANCLMEEIFPELSDDEWGALIRLRRGAYAFYRDESSAAILWIESGLGHIIWSLGIASEAHDVGMAAMRMAAIAENSHLSDRVTQFLKLVSKGGIR